MKLLGIWLLVAALVSALVGQVHGLWGLMFMLQMGFLYGGNALLLRHGKMSQKLIILLNAILLALYTVIGLALLNRPRG